MTVSEDIRALAKEGLKVTEIARRLGIRYQHAYNVLKQSGTTSRTVQDVQGEDSLNLTHALVLVSCVSKKLSHPAAARQIYCSEWFVKVRRLVESQKANWLILSAFYGVVAPDAEIAPYEKTLNTAGVVERRAWAERTLRHLEPYLTDGQRIVIFAGHRYREFLVPPLLRNGHEVTIPMANLRIGEQLAWLTART